jgi:hypothetical protein
VGSARRAIKTYSTPHQFAPAIRRIVACYLMAVGLFGAGIALQAWF